MCTPSSRGELRVARGAFHALFIFVTLSLLVETEVDVETIVSGGGRCDLALIGDESVALVSLSNDPLNGGVGGAISG